MLVVTITTSTITCTITTIITTITITTTTTIYIITCKAYAQAGIRIPILLAVGTSYTLASLRSTESI